ncbi:MAG TPA: signal peptidase I [Deltaproteobacteria bacterium]|nr:signal peptidase I [Deltaproteobacteria bacterium]
MAEDQAVEKRSAEEERPGGAGRGGSKAGRWTRETIEAVVIALVLAVVIRTFVVQAFKIPSSSMEDTLLIGDHILVSKFSYGIQVPKPAMINVLGLTMPFFTTELKPLWGEIERGDVIVFRPPHEPDKDYIKRVVGIPGDTVEIRDKKIYINGEPWDDPYGVYKGATAWETHKVDNFGPIRVPEGKVFVMGDNRDRSYDSRFWGFVDMKDIKGRAFMIYWSWDSTKTLFEKVRFSRIGRIIR